MIYIIIGILSVIGIIAIVLFSILHIMAGLLSERVAGQENEVATLPSRFQSPSLIKGEPPACHFVNANNMVKHFPDVSKMIKSGIPIYLCCKLQANKNLHKINKLQNQRIYFANKIMDKTTKAILLGIVMAILLLTIAVSTSSCKTCQCVPERIEVEKEVIVTKHDSIITTKADSASALALLHCDSLNQVVLDELYTVNGERIKLSAQLKQLQGNMSALDIQCNEDSLQQRIEWLETQLNEKSKETIVKTEYVVPSFYKNCTILFWIIIVVLVLYIAARILIAIYLRR